MMSARSFGNYDLAGALADLVDNSIKAGAQNIRIRCTYNDGDPVVSVRDDGHGMSAPELEAAMRPASTNPSEERSPDDLGRFGWGMKSASFSQCRKLVVLAARDHEMNGAIWDLDDIDDWAMGVLAGEEVATMVSHPFDAGHGTEVIWQNCDRLSEDGKLTSTGFNETVSHAADRLALVFHRFIEGKLKRPHLNIHLNGTVLAPFDPFHTRHAATQRLEVEPLRIAGQIVPVQPFVLPHYSRLGESEHDKLGGEEGFLRNQGFYVYRNDRLIIHGTWFRLAKYGELSQLVRISVDIPNSMDDMWKITVDKSDAQLPAVIRNRLRQIVDGIRGKSARVYRSRGGRLDDPRSVSVWSRHARNSEINYSINREHPVIARLLETESADDVRAMINLIEQNFPVTDFSHDVSLKPHALSQSATSRQEMKRLLDLTIPGLLADGNGDLKETIERLKITEPFSRNWSMVEEYISDKGW
ncbi:ATP-binding protein [Hoeflea sp.]|uniref:ATP-binding protein n=1 Tax=Hoeflea sp. TaxID=1940281 RepID=UPI003B02297F